MNPIRPAMFTWTDDEVMKPHARFLPLCQRQFVVGEDYALTIFEQRSTRAHNRLFAAIGNLWENLPEGWAQRFPTSEHLRKWLLVRAGHAVHADYVMDTPRDAMMLARGLRRADEYAVIKVSRNVVEVWTAKSISRAAVPTKQEFMEISDRVLDGIEMISENTREEIEHEAQQKMLPPARRATFDGGER